VITVECQPQTHDNSAYSDRMQTKPRWTQEDMRALILRFLDNRKQIHPVALDILSRQEKWGRNVRGMLDFVESLVTSTKSPAITPLDLPFSMLLEGLWREGAGPYADEKKKVIEGFDRLVIEVALTRNRGNLTNASRELGLDRANFQRLMRKYGLASNEYRTPALLAEHM
jgi:DNA-binding NtrC family response regulator